MLLILFVATLSSFFLTILLIRFQHLHVQFSADCDLNGIQKFHAVPVPRIGGVPIFSGLIVGFAVSYLTQNNLMGLQLLMVALPAAGAGLIEDLTKKVSVRQRLFATFVAALLGSVFLHANIQSLDIGWLDQLLGRYWIVSVLFTMVAVGGVAHSINIIDGYNGLSGMVALFVFIALAYVSFKVNDGALLAVCFAACGAVLGFLCLNYPRGLIFSGDGGAYLVGFLIAEVSVLLVIRNPQVSPWFPLLLVIYPVFETVFSMYRRKFLQDRAVGCPDALHLHQMVYRRMVRWMVGSKEARHLTRRNSLTAPYLWGLAALSVAPAMLFWNHTHTLMACVFLFVMIYLYVYRMIVRFKTPTWLVVRRRR
jgi:UDP-N-acetylmuramyl pentapeptide phosphotransferase/UDP-N-acetylglucosamine-1-phosphate transferase